MKHVLLTVQNRGSFCLHFLWQSWLLW